ncbi:MAG: hypothetical protein HY236_14875 [Acidobacteria bacterium]|nr:hypothetical protein [Acidobacteriota bacterium]
MLAAALAAGLYAGEPSGVDAGQVLDSYLLASRTQRQRLNGSTAEVSFEAEIPKLHKMGRLSALRRVSRLGRLTYDILRYEGDNSVKNNVIARYLSAEVQVRESSDDSLSIIPQNYKFSYRGTRHFEGRRVYAFDVKPRAKRKGLFKGSIWIDAEDYLLVRETGRFVRNPSVFIKKVQFTRDYQHKDGLAVVTRLETTVETRVVGPAHMTVNYADYRFEPSFVNVGLIQTDSQ